MKLRQTLSAESRAAGFAFRPRATDVIIAPSPEYGTTWLQQMVDSVRRLVPWDETIGARFGLADHQAALDRLA